MTRDDLRLHFQSLRRAVAPEDRATRSARIQATLAAHPLFAEARVVAAYMGVGGEPTIEALLDPTLREIALPRTVGRTMTLHRWDGGALVPGVFRIPEPAEDTPLVRADRVDVWLVPGVAFDQRGNRLGRGAGHYDRMLAGAPGLKIGVAWAAQVIDALPVEPHDVPMDAVVTEAGWAYSGLMFRT